jgi:hypothetical protein
MKEYYQSSTSGVADAAPGILRPGSRMGLVDRGWTYDNSDDYDVRRC